ncbi:Wzz/FepE/Etk N-terminal domain-containing protein, partial [Escherichia coli]|nr:tyrosine-protein kinase [Escherichia coli]
MSSIKNKPEVKDSEDFDIGRLLGEIIDHRKLIISITSLFAFTGLLYVLLSTPVYQADALIQVEQKQANAILGNLSQILPDSQPQSAPEIALLQSRMILGKTVDDLNLQIRVEQEHFPIFGKGLSRLLGQKDGTLNISLFSPVDQTEDIQKFKLTVEGNGSYVIYGENVELKGRVGETLDKNGFTVKLSSIQAEPGTSFTVTYVSKLKAISDIQESLTINDQGKDTGILAISLN